MHEFCTYFPFTSVLNVFFVASVIRKEKHLSFGAHYYMIFDILPRSLENRTTAAQNNVSQLKTNHNTLLYTQVLTRVDSHHVTTHYNCVPTTVQSTTLPQKPGRANTLSTHIQN